MLLLSLKYSIASPSLIPVLSYSSDSDPIPTWLVKECASVIIPTITNIINLSLSSGHVHPLFKQSVVSPLLKKSTLDNEQLSNYRPIFKHSLISKISNVV